MATSPASTAAIPGPAATHARQCARLVLVLLRQRASAPLSQSARAPRLRHRAALALLGAAAGVAAAVGVFLGSASRGAVASLGRPAPAASTRSTRGCSSVVGGVRRCSSSASPPGRSTTCCPRCPRWPCSSAAGWRRMRPDPHHRACERHGSCSPIGSCGAAAALFFALHSPSPTGDLAAALSSNPGDYAFSFGHFLDLSTRAMAFFRVPLLLTAVALLAGTGGHLLLRRVGTRACGGSRARGWRRPVPRRGAYGAADLLAGAVVGPLADAIRPLLRPGGCDRAERRIRERLDARVLSARQVRILNGRSSNLWYGSFFSDAPAIFDDDASIARLWSGPRRVFLLTDAAQPPRLPGAVFTLAIGRKGCALQPALSRLTVLPTLPPPGAGGILISHFVSEV